MEEVDPERDLVKDPQPQGPVEMGIRVFLYNT
jgi:hypothetical protein